MVISSIQQTTINPAALRLKESLKAYGLGHKHLATRKVTAKYTDSQGNVTELGEYKLVDLIVHRGRILHRAVCTPGLHHFFVPRNEMNKQIGPAKLIGVNPNQIGVWQRGKYVGYIRDDGVLVLTNATDPELIVAWLEATYSGLRTGPVQPRNHRGVKYFLSQELAVIAYGLVQQWRREHAQPLAA